MQPDEFSQRLESAYREALQGADAIKEQAARLLAEAERERDAAKEARARAEAEGRERAEAAFEQAREAQRRAVREELLRGLVRKHLQAGRAAADIETWLEAGPELIEQIREELAPPPRNRSRAIPAGLPPGARVGTTQDGRSGTVWFECAAAKFDVWWEFAGGNALAIVELPTPEQWTARTGLPAETRGAVTEFMGQQLVAQQAPGGSFKVGDDVLTLYSAGRRPRAD